MPHDQNNQSSRSSMAGRKTYHVVSDTISGLNLRWRDNLYQALFISCFTAISIGVGVAMMPHWFAGVMIGGFVGLLVSVLLSGVFLMIYRGVRHLSGRHE